MRRIMIALGLGLVVGVGACHLLLPERFAVRGPMVAQMLGLSSPETPPEALVRSRLRVRPGYTVEIFAEGVENARFMRFSPGGALLVSQPRLGRILHVLRDGDGDGRSDGQRALVEGLDRPHGLDFRGGHLYVGETGGIARVAVREPGLDLLETRGPVERIVEGLPPGGNHWSRTLRFGPDGGLYLHVGSSCNVCEEEDPRRATMLRFEPDGSGEEIYAAGLRNSVGFDWQPGTDDLYATDNGRDLLGDDYPPCELNRVVRGGFYGWPYANGDAEPDPDFGPGHEDRVASSIPPVHAFRAHNAPLGITFLRHPDRPEAFRNAALVALHGSWNRTTLDGYKVVSLHWGEDGTIEERDFLTGFEVDQDVIGRPVDVIEADDGSIFVSDDYSGTIYRVHRGVPSEAAADGPRSAGVSSRVAHGTRLADLEPSARLALQADGEALFARHACGTCHLTAAAAPGVVVHPLDDLSTRYSVDQLTRFLKTPTPPMPVFPLAEDERRALAVHLLSRFE